MAEEEFAIGIGDPNEMKHFVESYPVFMERLAFLNAVRDKVFQRKGEGKLFDIVIFAFGKVCAEDFQQAYILCGNGFGIGASQILREMYERHVTAAYLLKHPDELEQFLEYDKVHRYKGFNHFASSYTADELDKIISKETQERIKAQYDEVKGNFRMTLCKKCKSTQPMFSWTTLSTLDLAKRTKRGLEGHYYNDFYEPTIFTHSTASALQARMRADKNGHPFFDAEGQRKKVGTVLMSVHLLLLFVLDLQNDFFKLGIDDDIKQLEKDYRDCWTPNEPARPDSETKAVGVPAAPAQPPSTEDKSQ